mgnify:CR=1 FL=1
MGGPKSPIKVGGGAVKVGSADIMGDIANPNRIAYNTARLISPNIKAPFSAINSADLEKISARINAQKLLDAKAVEMGFASEADRVSQVSRIIDSFGKVKKGKLPAALAGAKTSYTGNTPGIMTKAGG